MKNKRRGSCVRTLMIFLLIVTMLVVAATSLLTYMFAGDNVETTLTAHSVDEAIRQLEKLSDEYGYKNALSDLTEKSATVTDGDSYYRLQQNYQGIPVYGRTVVCATDEDGDVISITGNIVDVGTVTDLSPTVTEEEIVKSINNYLALQMGLDISGLEFAALDNLDNESLCIYILNNREESRLAYSVNIDIYEFVIDAHNAEILSCSQTIYQENTSVIGYAASDVDKDSGFPIEKRGDYYYVMCDPSRGLSVYTFNGRISQDETGFWRSRATIVESTDKIFGNTDAESAMEYEEGAKLLLNVTAIHDYFFSVGFSSTGTTTNLYYNDGYDSGENALGGKVDGYGIISMGAETGVNCIDVIAHEYTHFVSRELVGWIGNYENGALNEAMSDIFGEIIESKVTGNEIDWMMGTYRDIQEPYLLGNPIVYKGVDWQETSNPSKDNDNGYVHSNSTVISHAAYLMWNGIDGAENKKIEADMLAKLWYRAMLMMPADCDFSTCRQMVEGAALAVDGLTEVQRECIAEAFDAVGIYDIELSPEILIDCDQNVASDAVLNVYNIDGELHPRYTLEIVGTIAEHELSYSTNIISDTGYHYETTKTITVAKSYHLDLPDGYYTFKITDRNNPQYEYTFTVSISDEGTENIIELYTDFKDQLLVNVTGSDSEGDTDSDPTSSIVDTVESRTGLHCEWAVNGDFDGDGSNEIYAFVCTSATDYSNGQLWYFTASNGYCQFYFGIKESGLFCSVVKVIPDWLAIVLIRNMDKINEFI